MQKGIIAKKVGMTQLFDENGKVVPVTIVEAGPCTVVQKKTVESDGYQAVQLGFGEVTSKHMTKAVAGHFAKADVAPKKTLREFRLDDISALNIGDVLKADVFAAGDTVDVIGKTRGRGYTGTIQRWNTHRGPMAHGSKYHRGVGSLSANSWPSRVFKNKGMPGQYGQERVTIQNLTVVRVDAERNLLLIKGGVPGARGTLLLIRDAVKK
jgi:large subunit ribosomal protein L3